MFGDGLPGRVEVFGDGIGCHGPEGDEQDDGPSGRVCYGLEYVASHDRI